ncbi:MAG: serine/threonine-protein kinase, partial [Pseudomonadota bacterium]
DWLIDQCTDEPELVDEILRLIDCSDGDDSPLESAVQAVAADLDRTGLQQGQRLGAYRVLHRIGRGGMGEVYLAERHDREYRHRVAIKVIRGHAGLQAMERFRRERQILADLQHPHIARLLDGGTTEGGQPYLVMDHVDGRPLKRWLESEGPSVRDRVRLFIRICDAVHHAHQHLVIHRDIKPGNVLVTPQGEPVLVDFGIAKMLSESGDETSPDAQDGAETARGSFTLAQGYTPGYASPEQRAGRAVTTASDIFSLGCLLGTLLDHGHSNDRSPIPEELAAVIGRASRTVPENRYSTAAELRREVIRFLERRPVEAMPGRWTYRTHKFIQRHSAAVGSAGLLSLALLIVLWVWSDDYQRAEQAESRALIEARHGEQVLGFLLDAIAAAEPARAQGREVSVRDVVNQGYQRIMANDQLEAELRARLQLALGEVYLRLEDHEPAVELLAQAATSEVPATSARASSLLGYWLTLKDDLEAARPHLDQALAVVERSPGLPAEVVSETRNHQALWLLESDQPEAAATIFADLVEVHRASGDEQRLGRMLHNLGLSHQDLDRLQEAIAAFEESLQVKQAAGQATTPSFANTLSAKAQTHVVMGDYESARAALQASMDLRIRLFGEAHPGLHHDANEYGSMLHDRGEFDLAIEQYQRALELHALSGAPEISSASYINNLASAHEDRGDLARAEPLFRSSLALREAAYGPGHGAVARAQHNLARLLIKTGDLDAAEAMIESAVSGWSELRGMDHVATLYSRSLEGHLLLARGEPDLALQELTGILTLMREGLAETNWWVLNVRALQAEALINTAQYDGAEAELQQLIDDYDAAFGTDHPLAQILALQLARIELLTDRAEQGESRLRALESGLRNRLALTSVHQRQLDCLLSRQTDSDCWR